MKILQTIRSVDPALGGPIEALIQQSNMLEEAGHAVEILTLDPIGLVKNERLNGRVVHFVGSSAKTYGYSTKIREWLEANGRSFDIIIIHGMWQYHGLAVWRFACRHNIPYVIFLHGMLDPWFKRNNLLKQIKKWVYWLLVEYKVLRDARQVLFTTQEELNLARTSFWLYKVRERMVGFGIFARSNRGKNKLFLDAYPKLRNKKIILYLSRIHPKKGCDILIEAYARIVSDHPHTHLVIAGPDSMRWQAQLIQRTEELGITANVTFPGMLTGDIKWGAYDAADIFVLPSHQENFGIVIAEALSSALPVITTYRVNIWREIDTAQAGLVDEDTVEGTYRSLASWFQLSDIKVDQMRSDAARCFKENFDISISTASLNSTLKAAASDNPEDYTFISYLPK